jgi:uncharacterized protein YdiU (UPF0061 family)
MSSFDDISKMFHTEHEKLTSLIDLTSQKSDLSLHEIVETYYQIMNMSSMITMLKQQLGSEHKSLLDKIIETDVLISEKFNGTIHPQILQNLTKSIKDTTTNLQSDTSEKSPEEIENNAKQYEELRKKMSTKEFVEQYDQGLSHD